MLHFWNVYHISGASELCCVCETIDMYSIAHDNYSYVHNNWEVILDYMG